MAPEVSVGTGASGARAAIHRIIDAFRVALTAMGARIAPIEIERLGVLVHEAISGRARLFHTSDHVFELASGVGVDATEMLAILYHDVVYLQIDGMLPPRIAVLLGSCSDGPIEQEPRGFRARVPMRPDPLFRTVLRVFGIAPGASVSTSGGLNELLSATVAAHQLAPFVPEQVVVAVVACIEATIPFRGADAEGVGPYDRLAGRLQQLDGVSHDEELIRAMVRRAVRVANRDTGNFASIAVTEFLDNTWKLLPETNPALRGATSYSISEYRAALCKTDAFLGSLDAARIFHRWGGEPDDLTYLTLLERSGKNLRLAARYLGVKLYAVAVLEALAMCTGGDSPIELFRGAVFDLGGTGGGATGATTDIDPVLLSLFADGRTSDLAFDLRQSPIAAFVYRRLGETRAQLASETARRLADRFPTREAWADEFLKSQPGSLVAAVARALAEVVGTRAAALRALALELDRI